MLRAAWDRWRVGQAETWCEICGVSFWNLSFTPELVRRVKWTSGDPAVIEALKELHTRSFPDTPCTRASLLLDAKAIENQLGRGQIEEPCSLPN